MIRYILCLAAVCGLVATPALGADIHYAKGEVYLLKGAISGGKLDFDKVLVAGEPLDLYAHQFSINAELVMGPPSAPQIVARLGCHYGHHTPRRRIVYSGRQCDHKQEIASIPDGTALRAAISTDFDAGQGSQEAIKFANPSMSLGRQDAILPYPKNFPKVCGGPVPARAAKPSDKIAHLELTFYAMTGALRPDGTIDNTRLCIGITPWAGDVVHAAVFASIVTGKTGQEAATASILCEVFGQSETLKSGQTFLMNPYSCNYMPTAFRTAAGAKPRVLLSASFGTVGAVPLGESMVKIYPAEISK